MFKKSKVFFKGKGSGLIIVLDEDSDFEELREELLEKTVKSKTFFMGASEDIVFEGKELTSEQENELADIIVNNAKMEIGFINLEPGESFATKKREGANQLIEPEEPGEPDEPKPKESASAQSASVPPQISELPYGILEYDEQVLIYNGYVRSGKLIESEGNIVIIGGVNPGGEVFAGRNIIVFGQLKGKAVAGKCGDENCFIAAILMEPELLGISSYVTRFPDSKKERLNKTPSIAKLQSDRIIISPVGNFGQIR